MKSVKAVVLLVILVLLNLAFVLDGCAAWQASSGPAILSCIETQVEASAPGLINKVLAIAESGGADAIPQIIAIGETLGIDVFGCAVQHAHAKASPAGKAVLAAVAAKRKFAFRLGVK